jgi:hypothetical protein
MFWLIIIIIIASIAFVSLEEGFVPISMCVLAISTFIISLVCMNYLTNKSKKEPKEISLVNNINNSINKINEEISILTGEYLFRFSDIVNGNNQWRNLLKHLQKTIEPEKYKLIEDARPEADGNEKIKITKNNADIATLEIKDGFCYFKPENEGDIKIGVVKGLNIYKNENKTEEKLKEEIECLNVFLKTLSKLVGEDDSLICKAIIDKNIIKKLGKLEEGIANLNNGSHSCEEGMKKLVEIIESLMGYIDLISTRLLPKDSLLLVEIEKNIKIIEGQIKNLNEKKQKSIQIDEKIKNKTEDLIKLRDKKIEVLSKEPEGVLDKHEIRRSLTISLTIVYFMLLFFSIFSPVTTQVLNMTDMSPGKITSSDITVGDVSIMVTEANMTLITRTAPTNLQSPFIELFTYVYLAVIAFYFGSRAIETYKAMKSK